MIGPPTNSASVNCQPINSHRITPSSITRFVEANWNAMAAVKFAPLRKIERASATAAYEHEDDAAPSPHAIAIVRGESSGSRRVISDFDTTDCTAAERANPSTSAHRISQVIPIEMLNAWASAPASPDAISAVNALRSMVLSYTPMGYAPSNGSALSSGREEDAMTTQTRGYTATKDQLLGRLARIEGQIRGVSRMVEDDRYCIDVVTQINAARAALDKV